jgi:hypothetical protein
MKNDFTFEAAPGVDNLVLLAGDIGRFCDVEAYERFLLEQSAKFERVFLVAGKHEFYGSSREEGLNVARRLVNEPALEGKLHFLNRTRFDIPDSDVTLLACTLQSYIAPDYTKLTNDFARIKE